MSANTTLRTTARDLEVLEALGTYRFMSTEQVAALFFPSENAASARLRKLAAAKHAVPLWMPVRPNDPRAKRIWGLGAKGSRLLQSDGRRPPHLSPRQQRSALFLAHTLSRNDLRVVLELLSRNGSGLQLVTWKQARDEVRARVRIQTGRRAFERVTAVPDGYFAYRYNGDTYGCLLETDLGTVSVDRMAKRYKAYWRWWKSGAMQQRFGAIPFRVLTMVPDNKRLERLRKAALSAPAHGRRGSGLFWFATLDTLDFAAPEAVLQASWRTAQVTRPGPHKFLE